MTYTIKYQKANGGQMTFPGIQANSEAEAKKKFLSMTTYKDCKVLSVIKTGN